MKFNRYLRNRVSTITFASSPKSSSETRFLAPTDISETGFLPSPLLPIEPSFLGLSPILSFKTNNAIKFSLVGGNHEQLMFQCSGSNQDIISPNRLSLRFE